MSAQAMQIVPSTLWHARRWEWDEERQDSWPVLKVIHKRRRPPLGWLWCELLLLVLWLTIIVMFYRLPEIRWWWWWPFVQYGSLALHHNIAPCRPPRQFPVRVVQHDMHWKLKRHRAVQQQSPSRRRWTNRLDGQRSGLDMKKEVFGQQAYVQQEELQEVGRNKQEAEMQLFCCLIHSLILCKRRAT